MGTSNDCSLHALDWIRSCFGKRANCHFSLNLAAQERTSNRTRSFCPTNIHDYSRGRVDRLSQCQQIGSARTCASRRSSIFGVLSGSTAVGLVHPFDPKALEQPAFAANNGLTISAAPPTPWYKNQCIQKALAKGLVSAGIDAIGLIPGGGAVSEGLSLFHGAAAVSNGTAILGRVRLGAGIITTANGASNISPLEGNAEMRGQTGRSPRRARCTPPVATDQHSEINTF